MITRFMADNIVPDIPQKIGGLASFKKLRFFFRKKYLTREIKGGPTWRSSGHEGGL